MSCTGSLVGKGVSVRQQDSLTNRDFNSSSSVRVCLTLGCILETIGAAVEGQVAGLRNSLDCLCFYS